MAVRKGKGLRVEGDGGFHLCTPPGSEAGDLLVGPARPMTQRCLSVNDRGPG